MAQTPIARGVLLAVAAALAFGATTPVIAWLGRGVGPFATAALLYGGAAAAALVMRLGGGTRGTTGAGLKRSDAPRVAVVAVVGAAVAPVLLAWGLQRSGALVGSLLLNLEAVFTVALARMVFGEPVGRRVAIAVAMMVGGGVVAARGEGGGEWIGALAVAGATLGWAIDNALTRPLAEREPLEVIGAKAGIGVVITVAASLVSGEAMPTLGAALGLIACGATGYGLSLRLYLGAQRLIGAGRTGSVFAIAPFVGAVLGGIGGGITGAMIGAGALFGAGVYLHVTERHGHAHAHEPIEHDHVHRHDDGHHDHVHDPPIAGEHGHVHRHDRVVHDHDHAPDLHHLHH
jgi:drug/metabolite transporter (DMT)-like permease